MLYYISVFRIFHHLVIYALHMRKLSGYVSRMTCNSFFITFLLTHVHLTYVYIMYVYIAYNVCHVFTFIVIFIFVIVIPDEKRLNVLY